MEALPGGLDWEFADLNRWEAIEEHLQRCYVSGREGTS